MKASLNLSIFFAAMTIITWNPIAARALTAVGPANGLVCMSLDRQSLMATQQSSLPPVMAEPNPRSAKIGYPSAIVFAKWPLIQANGYTEMVRPNGQTGWIATAHLTTWHPMNGGTAKCVPSIMSNGKLGTSIH